MCSTVLALIVYVGQLMTVNILELTCVPGTGGFICVIPKGSCRLNRQIQIQIYL